MSILHWKFFFIILHKLDKKTFPIKLEEKMKKSKQEKEETMNRLATSPRRYYTARRIPLAEKQKIEKPSHLIGFIMESWEV